MDPTNHPSHGGDRSSVVVELPLHDAAPEFDLEKAVCSHGMFMMAPNQWDPVSKALQRPLRLADCDTSLFVRISHPPESPHALHIRVFDTDGLTPHQERSLLGQVRRMLRLSEKENKMVREFQEICEEAKDRGFGRMFRSPTLFEDMVKCILLCNCQWSRTLSMARALCELQLELQHPSSSLPSEADNNEKFLNRTPEKDHFMPKTPCGKEAKRRRGKTQRLTNSFKRSKAALEKDISLKDGDESLVCSIGIEEFSSTFPSPKEGILQNCNIMIQCEDYRSSGLESQEGNMNCNRIGNFPSPEEIACLDVKFLAKRCSLGYRARRILKLAQGVVNGSIQLKELEEACNRPVLSDYGKLTQLLKAIDGFGPFTSANVLMCVGFYHVIPTDSETIRHLKQVHKKNSTIQTIQREVEVMYGRYAPFQFLKYWSEVWHFYEEWFGKLGEMPESKYKLITAANMRSEKRDERKRIKIV